MHGDGQTRRGRSQNAGSDDRCGATHPLGGAGSKETTSSTVERKADGPIEAPAGAHGSHCRAVAFRSAPNGSLRICTELSRHQSSASAARYRAAPAKVPGYLVCEATTAHTSCSKAGCTFSHLSLRGCGSCLRQTCVGIGSTEADDARD